MTKMKLINHEISVSPNWKEDLNASLSSLGSFFSNDSSDEDSDDDTSFCGECEVPRRIRKSGGFLAFGEKKKKDQEEKDNVSPAERLRETLLKETMARLNLFVKTEVRDSSAPVNHKTKKTSPRPRPRSTKVRAISPLAPVPLKDTTSDPMLKFRSNSKSDFSLQASRPRRASRRHGESRLRESDKTNATWTAKKSTGTAAKQEPTMNMNNVLLGHHSRVMTTANGSKPKRMSAAAAHPLLQQDATMMLSSRHAMSMNALSNSSSSAAICRWGDGSSKNGLSQYGLGGTTGTASGIHSSARNAAWKSTPKPDSSSSKLMRRPVTHPLREDDHQAAPLRPHRKSSMDMSSTSWISDIVDSNTPLTHNSNNKAVVDRTSTTPLRVPPRKSSLDSSSTSSSIVSGNQYPSGQQQQQEEEESMLKIPPSSSFMGTTSTSTTDMSSCCCKPASNKDNKEDDISTGCFSMTSTNCSTKAVGTAKSTTAKKARPQMPQRKRSSRRSGPPSRNNSGFSLDDAAQAAMILAAKARQQASSSTKDDEVKAGLLEFPKSMPSRTSSNGSNCNSLVQMMAPHHGRVLSSVAATTTATRAELQDRLKNVFDDMQEDLEEELTENSSNHANDDADCIAEGIEHVHVVNPEKSRRASDMSAKRPTRRASIFT